MLMLGYRHKRGKGGVKGRGKQGKGRCTEEVRAGGGGGGGWRGRPIVGTSSWGPRLTPGKEGGPGAGDMQASRPTSGTQFHGCMLGTSSKAISRHRQSGKDHPVVQPRLQRHRGYAQGVLACKGCVCMTNYAAFIRARPMHLV